MDRQKVQAVLEAILFTMGESVEISRLAAVLEMDKKEIKEVLCEMQEKYDAQDRGISLLWLEESVQLSTKAEMYEYLIKIRSEERRVGKECL